MASDKAVGSAGQGSQLEGGAQVSVSDQDQSDSAKNHRTIIENARAAAAKEQGMTLWRGLQLYPKAIGWSLLISTCIVMEGYDISLVNNFCESCKF